MYAINEYIYIYYILYRKCIWVLYALTPGVAINNYSENHKGKDFQFTYSYAIHDTVKH